MKITLLVTLLFGLIFVTAVNAAEKTPTPQQQKMTTFISRHHGDYIAERARTDWARIAADAGTPGGPSRPGSP